ncbi:hypothetical protein OG943_00510 [Amycolatopsis sp. NBC_00345]|uniref:hypothetical protein n=1 Tax=Amycolatopsis sp. NBC_00345 TaxID=2975955 RepID=UPI002E274001
MAVEHGFPALGLRATDGTRTLAYSGDTITARDAVIQAAEHFPGPVAYAAPRAVFGV